MVSVFDVATESEERFFTNPWPAMIGALAILLLALSFATMLGNGVVVLVLLGLLCAAAGVTIRPGSPKVLAVATLCAASAYLAMLSSAMGVAAGLEALSKLLAGQHPQLPTEWDSARMVVGILTLVSSVATILMLLPRVVRRVVVSFLVILHFGGIVTATLTVPPSPWLASMAWAYFYRPYLESGFLVNAYHFYSPDPGPATLLWFYVKYDDGSADWLKTPTRGEPPLKLEYLRRISLAEYANQQVPHSPVPQDKLKARLVAAKLDGIDVHMSLPETMQYREPKPYSRVVLETYARRMFHHPPDPDKTVTGVRIYRVIHNIMVPKDFATDQDPDDPSRFGIYYMGEYDAEGNLKDPEDAYLYWLIPPVRFKPVRIGPNGEPILGPGGSPELERDPAVFPYLEMHVRLGSDKGVKP